MKEAKNWEYFGRLMGKSTRSDVLNELQKRVDEDWPEKEIFENCILKIDEDI